MIGAVGMKMRDFDINISAMKVAIHAAAPCPATGACLQGTVGNRPGDRHPPGGRGAPAAGALPLHRAEGVPDMTDASVLQAPPVQAPPGIEAKTVLNRTLLVDATVKLGRSPDRPELRGQPFNARSIQKRVRLLGERWPESAAHSALSSALVTPPAAMSPAVRERLAALVGRFL